MTDGKGGAPPQLPPDKNRLRRCARSIVRALKAINNHIANGLPTDDFTWTMKL